MPADIGGHRLHPTRSFVQDLVASRSLIDIRDLLEQNIGSAGAAQGQVADFDDVVSAGGVENRDDVEHLIAFVGLADDIALIGCTDQFEHLDRIETPTLQIGFAETDRELRQARRRLDLNVGRAGDLSEYPGSFLRLVIEQIEVVAEDVNHDRCAVPRECLFDALGKKRHDRGVHPDEARECSANIGLRLFDLALPTNPASKPLRARCSEDPKCLRTPPPVPHVAQPNAPRATVATRRRYGRRCARIRRSTCRAPQTCGRRNAPPSAPG